MLELSVFNSPLKFLNIPDVIYDLCIHLDKGTLPHSIIIIFKEALFVAYKCNPSFWLIFSAKLFNVKNLCGSDNSLIIGSIVKLNIFFLNSLFGIKCVMSFT